MQFKEEIRESCRNRQTSDNSDFNNVFQHTHLLDGSWEPPSIQYLLEEPFTEDPLDVPFLGSVYPRLLKFSLLVQRKHFIMHFYARLF